MLKKVGILLILWEWCVNMCTNIRRKKSDVEQAYLYKPVFLFKNLYLDINDTSGSDRVMADININTNTTQSCQKLEQISLFNAANYFVHLYDKITDNATIIDKYDSDPVKIQKLLFISLIYSYFHFNQSFLLEEEDIEIIYCECGIKIKKVYDEIRNYISSGIKIDEEITLTEVIDAIEKYKESKINKFDENNVPNDIKHILNATFFSFGSFNSTTLGNLINSLRNGLSSSIFSSRIPFSFKCSDIQELIEKNRVKPDIANNKIWEFITNVQPQD